jgi:hypothetical protein
MKNSGRNREDLTPNTDFLHIYIIVRKVFWIYERCMNHILSLERRSFAKEH